MEKGFELFNKAVRKKDSNPKINIEFLYENRNDLDKVSYWYQKTAESDNRIALYKLGKIYELGKGIGRDALMTFELYKQAAEKGYINGKYKLGYCYNHGIGTDIDNEKAFELYKIAAEKGNYEAQKILTFLCEQRERTK